MHTFGRKHRHQCGAKVLGSLSIAIFTGVYACAQVVVYPIPETVPLWPSGAPSANGKSANDQPDLTILRPTAHRSPTKTAVLILPGGGYAGVVFDREGIQPGRWINNLGVTAFVLRYRVAPYRYPVEQWDAERAMRWIRANAAKYGLDPTKIGVWGFSAGGHLASLIATTVVGPPPGTTDEIDSYPSRPDFLILSYAVIDPIGPASVSTFDNLTGIKGLPGPDIVAKFSTDRHVTADTPPTFIVASSADPMVYSESSANFYLALRKAKVPAELHIYQDGPHGFDLASLDPVLSTWTQRLADWLRVRNLLNTN